MKFKELIFYSSLTGFFIIQFLAFLAVQWIIYEVYLYRIYVDENWGYSIYTITFLSFVHYCFSLLLDYTLQKDNVKTKIILLTNLLPLLILFNYENIIWALTLAILSLLGMFIWYLQYYKIYK